jgi:flagellar basal-body rod protein FlgB
MSFLDTPNIQSLSRALDRAAERQTVIARNIANIDTPGYRTVDADFRTQLANATGEEQASFHTRQVPGLLQRPDGNNVSLEREGLLMAETQLKFRTAVELLRVEFRRLQAAIQGGGGL